MSANANALLFEDAFVTDINQKMKVPDKISFNNDANSMPRADWMKESINMQVPERILVAGHHQHVGTRAPPREIIYDKSILDTDSYPGDVRVATPPRSLTLDKYPFPEFEDLMKEEEEENKLKNKPKKVYFSDPELLMNNKDSSPPLGGGGDSLTSGDDVVVLRKQMTKLNRRIMALEMENINRLQREKFVLGFGVAYFLFKFIIWMSKD